MNKKVALIVFVEAVIGFGIMYFLKIQADAGSHYETFDLEYLPSAVAFIVTMLVLVPTILVGTVGGLVRGRGNKWVNIITILIVITLAVYWYLVRFL